MNSNLIHNVLTAAIVIVAMLVAGLVSTGCVTLETGSVDCSASWLPPKVAGVIIVILGILKTGVNLVRDGLGGLYKPQPKIEE